eukprot:3558018-Pleurochrysis_carterae.AAC.1
MGAHVRSRVRRAASAGCEARVWALELEGNGKRKFVVATRDDFWERYRRLQVDHATRTGGGYVEGYRR